MNDLEDRVKRIDKEIGKLQVMLGPTTSKDDPLHQAREQLCDIRGKVRALMEEVSSS